MTLETTCYYCGRDDLLVNGAAVHRHTAVLDHVVPRRRGGSDEASNLVTACWRCNSSKCDQLFPLEWVPDMAVNTVLLGGRFDPPMYPLTLGERGLRDLLSSGPCEFSVLEVAAITGDAPNLIQRVITRMVRSEQLLLLPLGPHRPWQRRFLPAGPPT